MRPPSAEPIGVILAGGSGRRIGGSKAIAMLAGRPLISYPLAALQAALHDVVVLAKQDTALPALREVEVWIEERSPQHPLTGIIRALDRADGRAVLVCAVDLPFVSAELVRRIAQADPRAHAVIASHRGETQPLLGCYRQSAIELIGRGGTGRGVREAVASIDPELVEVDEPDELFNVNTPDDLLLAETIASRT